MNYKKSEVLTNLRRLPDGDDLYFCSGNWILRIGTDNSWPEKGENRAGYQLPGTGAAAAVAKWRAGFFTMLLTVGLLFLNDSLAGISRYMLLILTR